MKANIDWITDTLATGGDLSQDPDIAAEQVMDIMDQDVQLVIDVREEDNDAEVWAEVGIEYLWLPTDDADGHHIPPDLFHKAVLEASFYLDAGDKVLVHCHMGVNRGPSVAYGILLAQGMDPVKAFDLVREKRPKSAVLYAMDALDAELLRKGTPHHGVDRFRLEVRMKQVWTPEEKKRIEHVIRQHAKADKAEYAASIAAKVSR